MGLAGTPAGTESNMRDTTLAALDQPVQLLGAGGVPVAHDPLAAHSGRWDAVALRHARSFLGRYLRGSPGYR